MCTLQRFQQTVAVIDFLFRLCELYHCKVASIPAISSVGIPVLYSVFLGLEQKNLVKDKHKGIFLGGRTVFRELVSLSSSDPSLSRSSAPGSAFSSGEAWSTKRSRKPSIAGYIHLHVMSASVIRTR
jgi:hypothetical protein